MKGSIVRNGMLLSIGLAASFNVSALTLKEVIQETLNTSPDVLITTTERNARTKEVRQAKAGYYPTLDLRAGIGSEWTRNPTVNPGIDMTRRELSLEARQMLFDGFGTKYEVARQTARVNSQAHTVMGTAEYTALRTSEVYLELLKQQQLLELARENLKVHQRIYDQIKLRRKSGVASQADMDQIEGRLALAESNVIASENNVQEAEANYMRVTGKQPEGLEKPADMATMVPAAVDVALQTALDNHPTLKSANSDVDAAHAQHDAAAHNNYPRFYLEAGRTWHENLDGVAGDNEDRTVMLRMYWNLLNGGKDKARREETAILIEEAKEIRNRTHLQVEEAMRLSWASFQTTKRQRDFLRRHMDSTRSARDVYAKQFNTGKRTLLDLLDTENEVFESRQAFLDAEYTHLYAQFRILNAMGKMLESMEIEAPAETALYGQEQEKDEG